jgi:hypothetical protein
MIHNTIQQLVKRTDEESIDLSSLSVDIVQVENPQVESGLHPDYEKYMIGYYGRKDLGTGILRNRTDGGQGPAGSIRLDRRGKNHELFGTGKPFAEGKTFKSGKDNPMYGIGENHPLYGTKDRLETCEHCDKTMSYRQIKGYHGDKCKYKVTDDLTVMSSVIPREKSHKQSQKKESQ